MTDTPAAPSRDKTLVGNVGKSSITIGRFTYGFEKMSIREWGEGAPLSIGSFCSIATGVTIFLGGEHRVDWVTTFPFGHIFGAEFQTDPVQGHPWSKGAVNIGNDVWIGSGATILSGVSIGDGAVVGANALVTSDVAPYTVVGGNPAKVIKLRFSPDVIDLLLQIRWWEWPVDEIKASIGLLCSESDVSEITEFLAEKKVGVVRQ